MIVYNITFSVDQEIADEWLSWMKEKHIPSIHSLFETVKIMKVMSHDDEATSSFAVQFFSTSIGNIEKYSMNDDVEKKYGDRVLPYPTLLKEV